MSGKIVIGNNGSIGWRPKPRQNYSILKMTSYKGYIFLLSVVSTYTGTAQMWSTHKYEGNATLSLDECKKAFQLEHNRQIEALILKDLLNEPEEFKANTIQDDTKRIN